MRPAWMIRRRRSCGSLVMTHAWRSLRERCRLHGVRMYLIHRAISLAIITRRVVAGLSIDLEYFRNGFLIFHRIDLRMSWRRERDSNPRYGIHRTHAFQACTLSHSVISPGMSCYRERRTIPERLPLVKIPRSFAEAALRFVDFLVLRHLA